MLTRGWSVAADTGRSGESARVCLSQWAWNATRVHPGTGQSYSPTLPTGKLRQRASDLPGPQAQQWQHLARTQPPPPTPHPHCGEGLSPPGSINPLPPSATWNRGSSPRVNPTRALGATRGPSLVPGKDPPPTPRGPADAKKHECPCCPFKSLPSSLFGELSQKHLLPERPTP